MSDIKFRLRTPANVFYEYSVDGGQLLRDAADYIERLEKDAALLNFLDERAVPGIPWIARESSTGRGYRVHQDWGIGTHRTVREAIQQAMTDTALSHTK